MRDLLMTAIVGIGATMTTDVWALVRKRLLGIRPPDYRLVGRWMGYFPRGRFIHESIADSPPVYGELLIGWTAHYLIGIAFAALLVAITGVGWIGQPTIGPALFVGTVTVLAPFLLLQPGLGAGIAASKTANPASARVQSLLMHIVFGLGLYISALAARELPL